MSLTPQSNPHTSTLRMIRNRVIAGLFVVLPLFVTWLVVKWLYDTLVSVLIGPIRDQLKELWRTDIDKWQLAGWVVEGLALTGAVGLVICVLFIAGMFFRSRLHRFVDWILSTVPGVNAIYRAVSNVVDALSHSHTDMSRFKRVVLIEFPHPGIKVPAFVTSECRDTVTQGTILCVYVPTTPVPTSGYMLMVPEENVVPVDWDLQMTLQAIVSGGLTVPATVNYVRPPLAVVHPETVGEGEAE